MSSLPGESLVSSCGPLLLAGALAAGIVPPTAAMPQDLDREAARGRGLSATEAAALEERLAANPQDLTARAQLVGYYHGNRRASPRRHAEHVLWFIRNLPEAEVLGSAPARITPMFHPDGYLEAKRAWERLVRKEPDNVSILRHAANFHDAVEASLAAGLLAQAEALEPSNPEWARELAGLEWREARRFPEGRDPAGAARALVHFERAHDLSGAAGRIGLLPDLALAAYAAGEHDKARTHALAMLEVAPDVPDRADPVHYGNLVLGHLAVDEGTTWTRLGTACSPPVGRAGLPLESDSGRPDMSARQGELLDRGQAIGVGAPVPGTLSGHLGDRGERDACRDWIAPRSKRAWTPDFDYNFVVLTPSPRGWSRNLAKPTDGVDAERCRRHGEGPVAAARAGVPRRRRAPDAFLPRSTGGPRPAPRSGRAPARRGARGLHPG